MKKLIALMIVVASSFMGCGETNEPTPSAETEEVPYFDHGGYMLPNSHVNLLRAFKMTRPDEEGRVVGFNLDDTNTEDGDDEFCLHGDFMSPDGREGVDNQFADLWGVVEPLIGEATEALIQGAVNEGRIVMVLELEGVQNLQNDDDVTLHIYRGRIEPDVGNQGLISPDQTVYFDKDFPYFIAENISIVDGAVEASDLIITLPVDILDAYFTVVFENASIRFSIDESGAFSGIFGGIVDLVEIFDELLQTNASQEAELVQPIFMNYADLGKGPDGCTKASAAFEFEGTTAFSVRYPDSDDVSGAASAAED